MLSLMGTSNNLKEIEQKKLISIILPTHNGSAYIAQSIESCLNQSYGNVELIVVNDASEDNTKDIISSYEDPRIFYLENDRNMGLANSLNKGFSRSKGDFLTWTSDDNYYTPDALLRMLSKLKEASSVNFVYANYYRINEIGKIIGKVSVKKSLNLLRNNCVGPCFLFKRIVYSRIGEFDPTFFLAEDYEYWLRVLKRFKMKNMNDYLYFYRSHSDSLTSKNNPGNTAIVFRKAFEKHSTLSLRTRYHMMLFADKVKRLISD
jgi:glycosyltransferase involved in cell wall biosynthesis